jgi:hypothetical protein
MMPVSAQTNEVIMNMSTLTWVTGTPTLRAALASPPTPKIQFPTRVRASVHVPRIVMAIHHRTVTRKSYGLQKLPPKILVALS